MPLPLESVSVVLPPGLAATVTRLAARAGVTPAEFVIAATAAAAGHMWQDGDRR